MSLQIFSYFFYFNPRSRERSDWCSSCNGTGRLISIHAPAKGATCFTCLIASPVNISIHAPAKGATHTEVIKTDALSISIHAPAKGATLGGLPFFVDLWGISIHAPAKGATCLASPLNRWTSISIHAPAKGATTSGACISPFSTKFQSTLPRKERLQH